MSTGPKWMVAMPHDWHLLLCAVGIHRFYFSQAAKGAGRETLRECGACGLMQKRYQRYGDDRLEHGLYTPWGRL